MATMFEYYLFNAVINEKFSKAPLVQTYPNIYPGKVNVYVACGR